MFGGCPKWKKDTPHGDLPKLAKSTVLEFGEHLAKYTHASGCYPLHLEPYLMGNIYATNPVPGTEGEHLVHTDALPVN